MADPISPIIAGFITHMGTAAAKKAWQWVMAEDWPLNFAKQIRRESKIKVPIRRIESWLALPETKDSLAAPTEEKLAASFDSLKVALRPRIVIRSERYEPARLEALALNIFDAALDRFLLSLPLSEEIKIVHERESAQLDELKELLKPEFPGDLVQFGLPPNTVKWLSRAHEEAREETTRVLRAFRAQPRAPGSVLRDLLEPVVPWLSPGSPALLIGLGMAADSLDLPRLAKNAYIAAAENGAPDRPRWIAMAALTLQNDRDNPELEQLLDQLRDHDLSPIPKAIVAYLSGEPESILDIELEDLPSADDRAFMHRFRAHVYEVAGSVDRAIEELEAGVRVALNPGSLALHLAHSLLRRAITAGGVAATHDKRRAIELALEVRDQRRSWGGPTAKAIEIAAHASFSLQEAATALNYTMSPPIGEATESEAKDPKVAELAAQAALAVGHGEALAELIPSLEGFEQKWIQAELAKRSGDTIQAQRLLSEAWPVADDQAKKWAVQQAMADAGIWPIPDLDTLKRTNPLQAALVLAQSQARRGDPDEAERTIRPHATTSPSAAQLLAELQHERGNSETAGRTLTAAHERFNRPELLVGAALMFEEASEYEEARKAAEQAVGHLPSGSSKSREARSLLMRLAAKRNDMRSLAFEAQALIDDGEDDPGVKWLLAQGLARQYRFEEAWQVVRSLKAPSPTSEQDVHLWLTLGARFADEPSFVSAALDVVKAGTSEEVRGHGLLTVLAITRRVSVSDEVANTAREEIERFLGNYPETQIIQSVTFRDVDELFEKLAPELSRGADRYQELVEKVSQGQVPFGLLAAFVGKSYGEALLRRAAGCLPIIKPFADELARESQAISAALDGRVVIEPSALHILSLLPEWWPLVRALFKEISLPEPSRADLVLARGQLELRSTMSVGWDPRTNQAIVSEIEEDLLDRLIERVAWMDEQSKALDLAPMARLEHFSDLDDDAFRAWMGPVDLAVTSGAVLYSDDPTLRAIGREAGTLSFGSAAVFNYLTQRGKLSADQLQVVRTILLENFVVDLVPSVAELDDLAIKEEWSLGAAAFNVSRQLFWSSRQNPFEPWGHLIRSVKARNPQALAGWFMVGTIGLLKVADRNPLEVASQFLVKTFLLLKGDPDDFLLGVDGVRRGLIERGIEDDPLRQAVAVLLEEETLGAIDARARYAAQLFSSLPDKDRERGMRYILGLD